jgi:hypothetical protein
LAQGEPVKYGGEISFKNGQLQMWNNKSGHYLPSAADADDMAKILQQNGIPDATLSNFQSAGR